MKIPFKVALLFRKLQEAGCGPVRREQEEFRLRCPAHADRSPSLYVRITSDRILLDCKAGCSAQAICDAIDLPVADLFLDDEPIVDIGEHLDSLLVDCTAASGSQASLILPPSADNDLRHDVYQDILSALELSAGDFETLRKRGLTADAIEARSYRTVDTKRITVSIDRLLERHGREELLKVPGFKDLGGRVIFVARDGLIIPVRDVAGRIEALKIRHADGSGGPKYSWASSADASCGNVVHVPLGLSTLVPELRLTEGELKADLATALSGLPTISAPGVGNWQLAISVLKALGTKTVRIAFDQDGKPGTLRAMKDAIFGLAREHFEVLVEWWDSGTAKGIDDLFAVGGQPDLLNGLDAIIRIDDSLTAPPEPSTEKVEPALLPFPVDVLPPDLANFCQQVAQSTSTPPDFAGLAMLVTAGAAVGNSRALVVKNGWLEGPRFYGMIVAPSSSGKSPAVELVVQPYLALQTAAISRYEAEIKEFEEAKKRHDEGDVDEGTPPPEPPEKPDRLVIQDITVEAIPAILKNYPRGLLMVQDEGTAWVRAMGQYKKGLGTDRQFWLSAWSGKCYFNDRKCQEIPISVPRPFINVIGNFTPDMASELRDPRSRGDGFIERLLPCMAEASTGADWSDVAVDEAAMEAWRKTLLALRALDMVKLPDGTLGPRPIKFTPDALEAWVTWYNAHAAELRSSELPVNLIGSWGKLKSYAARLILIIDLLWQVHANHCYGDVDLSSVQRGLRLVDYFKSHLRRFYSRLKVTPEDNELLEILSWIRQNGCQCTLRQLVRGKNLTPTLRAKKLLDELVARGYGRWEHRTGKNGRDVAYFVFDPE